MHIAVWGNHRLIAPKGIASWSLILLKNIRISYCLCKLIYVVTTVES